MIQKKVCLLGTFAVGKTSLVRRFVDSIYSDKYHTTVGVKIDKRVVASGDQEMTLMIWDVEGVENQQELRTSYLRGASGYLLVADGTRRDTLQQAVSIQQRAEEILGRVPYVLLLNKADLAEQWEIEAEQSESLRNNGWEIITTSARTGLGVEEAFHLLAERMKEAAQ
jgi:small GTP-binding protein